MVIIASYAEYEDAEVRRHQPRVLVMDGTRSTRLQTVAGE
jgi:aspartate 1-decarboxylase